MTAGEERTAWAGVKVFTPGSRPDPEWFQHSTSEICESVNSFMRGKPDVVRLALVCLLAEGHLLLEDVPGVGKTSLVRSFAGALGVPWQRIQFTPDLLPSDVTGVSVFHQDTNRFVFHTGPVFTNLVLADEINRASPRTQSALLEVMAERTITVDGVSHVVPAPFMVLATQNPVEMDGTYPLPEAQLDRFLIKTDIGYPDHEAEVEVLQAEHTGHDVQDVRRVSSPVDIERLVAITRSVEVAPAVLDYIVRLVAHTRQMSELRLGASPRGAIGLLKTSRVVAALEGRDYVMPSDVQSLAGVVLAHRVMVSSAHEAAGMTGLDVIDKAVAEVPAPPVAGLR